MTTLGETRRRLQAQENGGACRECGWPVAQPHHAYCPDCFRVQQGWREPGGGEEGELVTLRGLADRLDEIEYRLDNLE